MPDTRSHMQTLLAGRGVLHQEDHGAGELAAHRKALQQPEQHQQEGRGQPRLQRTTRWEGGWAGSPSVRAFRLKN